MSSFQGFSRETLHFFEDLRQNNTKIWFEENRSIFDKYVLAEAKAFVADMGAKLNPIAPNVVAIPKIDKTIFRIHRDVRFSKNKDPYKTHLGMFFWEGSRKKLENSGFYIQLNPDNAFIGVGMHEFSPDMMKLYRDNVSDEKQATKLLKTINQINKDNRYELGWKKYKRVPRGYDSEYKYADLLLHGGLGFSCTIEDSKILHSSNFLEEVYKIFEQMSPIHIWLRNLSNNLQT